jgi:hypothetical protein
MRSPAVARIALVGLTAALSAALGFQLRPIGSRDLAPAAPAAVPPVATGASRESVEELREEIARLRALVGASLLARAPAPEPAEEVHPVAEPAPDPAGAEAAEPHELEDLVERFARDGVDSRWSGESIERIERSIADADLDGVYLTEVDCRSSLCRLELDLDPRAQTDQVTRQLLDALAWEGAGRLQLDAGSALLFLERSPG